MTSPTDTPLQPPTPGGPLRTWLAYNDAANRGAHDEAATFLTADLAVLVNGAPSVASPEEDRAVQTELLRSYPDYRRDHVAGIESGDVATVEWRMHGTPAPETGLPPLDVPGCSVVRCADGRIVEARLYHPTGALDRVADRALGRG